MDFGFKAIKLRKVKHGVLPLRKDSREDELKNFTFAEWQGMKRSPTCSDISQKPIIKGFYRREQIKLAKIHRSFDNRKKDFLEEVNEMNRFIRQIIVQHSGCKKNIIPEERALKSNECFRKYFEEGSEITPHFIKRKSRSKFPRDVFSSFSKGVRNNSNYN